MEIHQIKQPMLPNGTLIIKDLPFEEGEMVKITIEKAPKVNPDNPYPLRGTPYRYDDPFGPLIDDEDWKPFK